MFHTKELLGLSALNLSVTYVGIFLFWVPLRGRQAKGENHRRWRYDLGTWRRVGPSEPGGKAKQHMLILLYQMEIKKTNKKWLSDQSRTLSHRSPVKLETGVTQKAL